MPSLGASFGRGAATTAQWDLANADCVVIMGSNMAEAHPIAFRFVGLSPVVGAVAAGSEAARQDILPGDELVAMDGGPVTAESAMIGVPSAP